MPISRAIIHKINVARIVFFFGAQYFRDDRKRQEATIQSAKISARIPKVPWTIETMENDEKILLKISGSRLIKAGTITSIIEKMCRIKAENIVIPCAKNFFLLFNQTLTKSKIEMTNWKTTLI